MIDDPDMALYLVARLKGEVPFEARLGKYAAKAVVGKITDPARFSPWTVVSVDYAGDEWGIMCRMRAGDSDQVCHVSITHLMFERSTPFFRQIDKYQRHRIKKLKKHQAWVD